jgi:hypothetical protein
MDTLSATDCPEGASWLKGALHTHTTCSDGVLTPPELLSVYQGLGFDFVALTDHDFLLRPNAYADVPKEYNGMLVLRGVEKTIFARGYVHVNYIFGDSDELHIFNHPAEYGYTFPQMCERIKSVHEQVRLDAVEITQKGFYTPEYDVPTIPFPKVASDDAHTREACGRAWVEVFAARTPDAIVHAIRSGRVRNHCSHLAGTYAWSCTQR